MIVPDGIEPVEEWRTWRFDGKVLRSVNNDQAWTAGEALHAKCRGGGVAGFEWQIVRHGMSLDDARSYTAKHNERMNHTTLFGSHSNGFISAPVVEPSPGYGYALQPVAHETPHADCTCGIYAGRTIDVCPAGDVFGKVKLWGKIVPGTKGSRAEYAYPSELHVPAKWADDPAILAYGVPVIVDESPKPAKNPITLALYAGAASSWANSSFTFTNEPPRNLYRGALWVLWAAIALNLATCAFNLLHAFKVV